MANGWNGPDPVEAVDVDDYELGTRYRANADITLTHARIWTGPGEINITNRKARVWTTGGAQIGIASLPDNPAPGWTTYAYDSPVPITAGTQFVVSFSTGGNEGAAPGALVGDVTSADGRVTALAAASVVPGNGLYNLNAGAFPTNGSANQSFYGSDFVYEVGIGGNTAPRITGVTVSSVGALATVTIIAEDDETLVGASYRYTWGDGSPDTVSAAPTANHTYPGSGTYALLVTVTDAGGLSDVAATVVEIIVLNGIELRLYDVASILVSGISDDLAGTIGGRPKRACVVPGSIAWDECDCGGMLAIAHSRWFLSDNFPIETGPGTKSTPCELPLLVGELVIQIVRCAPSPLGNETAVSCARLDAASRIHVQDAYVTLRAARRILCGLKDADTILDYTFGEQTSVGPEGGCVGTELKAMVSIELR